MNRRIITWKSTGITTLVAGLITFRIVANEMLKSSAFRSANKGFDPQWITRIGIDIRK